MNLFTSESVCAGHPDKIADQISDAIVDECIRQDPYSEVSCNVLLSDDLIVLAGETTTPVDFEGVINSLGYHYSKIITNMHIKSRKLRKGADDQGIMFGFACDETPELMPMPIMLAQKLVRELPKKNGKVQFTIEYGPDYRPLRVHTVVISSQDDKKLVHDIAPKGFIDQNTLFYIKEGSGGKCGLTGRKIAVDTYGGMARNGGGAFSGKDPSKMDRSATYAARFVAKNIVHAGLARRCEVQISYAIGMDAPISIKVDTFGTGNEQEINEMIPKVFDLSPNGIIEMLDLRRPIYLKTAFGGHFGRDEFTWENTDYASSLKR